MGKWQSTLEKMELNRNSFVYPSFWKGKKVLLTGHTGFKGSWLSIWLKLMGVKLTGYSLLPSTNPSLFEVAKVKKGMKSIKGDIRNFKSIFKVVKKVEPEIIIHFAAQPLVRNSYTKPKYTYETNVMGTINLLEAARKVKSVKVFLNVTSDKCYENKDYLKKKYKETDPMGGDDPYSSSKACSELITKAYRSSFFENSKIALATARSGNIIGGGDWSKNRLVPDILRSINNNKKIIIRSPESVRPWQYVLEALSGYMILIQKLYENQKKYSKSWNFGPNNKNTKTVKWIVEYMIKRSGLKLNWEYDKKTNVPEANYLDLDTQKTKSVLNWKTTLKLKDVLNKTIDWHKHLKKKQDMHKVCERQINTFIKEAKKNL
ncbi:CDP-glucose 4,6-dehydratase [Candidatus Pelagibacter sp. HIMB1593]|uniref:CDP-glucose 4,6-dehydratase n=1 Tax=Candidatus Pelagibacter sp. HIMB1593 TaxID=3413355 RepID=UPI003F84F2EF